MRIARTAQRTRTALTALVGVAVLGLAACGGPSPPAEEEDASPPGAEQSDGGGEPAPSDGDGDTSGAPSDGGGQGEAAGERTRIMFVPDPAGPADVPAIGADELADELSAPFDAASTCEGELVLATGETQRCEGPTGFESTRTVPWTAHPVRVADTEAIGDSGGPGILFTQGPELDEDAREVLRANLKLTGLGFGSMFGAEEIDAADLAQSTLQVLTSQHAYIPVREALPDADTWSEVSCDDAMTFEEFEPVDCTATSSEGARWQLRVLPGTFVDNDQGLLVAIGGPVED